MLFSTFRPSCESKSLSHAFRFNHACSCTKLCSKGATSFLVEGIGSTIATSAASRAPVHGRDSLFKIIFVNACCLSTARPSKTNKKHDPGKQLGEVCKRQIVCLINKLENYQPNLSAPASCECVFRQSDTFGRPAHTKLPIMDKIDKVDEVFVFQFDSEFVGPCCVRCQGL